MEEADLGGRLALLDPTGLDDAQKPLHARIMQTMVPWAQESGFESTTAGGRLIGPFNPLLLSPAIAQAFLDLQDAEKAHSSLDARMREIVILTIGGMLRADYELYAHAAVARAAGLPEAAIQGLASGGVPDALNPQERLAARFVRELSISHRVDPALYREAEAAFGARGLADIIYLAGCYHTVGGMLNAFAIPVPVETRNGASGHPREATLTTVALFPTGSFLENLAVRHDNSVLVTSMNARELFYVAPSSGGAPVEPVLLHRFDQLATGLVEIEPDLFLVSTSNAYTDHDSFLHLVDMRGYEPGAAVWPETLFHFPPAARGLNGCCLLAPGIVLIADCFAGLIWRVAMQAGGRDIAVRPWLSDESMGYYPGTQKPEQPGVNGVHYAARTGHLYYTSTAKKLLMRVAVDPATLEAAGAPELVLAGRTGDDFCIDEEAGVLYLATHRQNSIDRVAMNPAENSGFPQSVVGHPFTEAMIGPCSLAWGRAPGDYGKLAFVISDGGTASPHPGGPLPARLQRVVF